MTSASQSDFGDPLSVPFWNAARRHELVVQRCESCASHQFYPRPFCLRCYSGELVWITTAGTGVVYSQTTILMGPDPYTVALIDLTEGPRIMASLVGDPVAIGDDVRLTWQHRDDAPPLPAFTGRGP